ncbi:MAG: HesA/MoeB/ThiF family protein [Promethearchaeota archaeon]
MDKWNRYSRQIIMPEIGTEGQEKLANTRVAVVGTGGLGSPILLYLAAAGIGLIRFIDNDDVDLSNLNRQIIHSTSTIGTRKTESARKTLKELNPEIELDPIDDKLSIENAESVFKGMDYIIDASDNFETKFLVNDTAVKMNIPFTIGGVIRWDGQLMSVIPGKSACYRCVFSSPPEKGTMKSPKELGIIGVTAGIIGTIAAAEAIKHALSFSENERLVNKLLVADLRSWNFSPINIKKNPRCKTCGKK